MKHIKSLTLLISMTVFAVVLLGACGNQQDEGTMENGAGEEMHQNGHEGHDHDMNENGHEGHDHEMHEGEDMDGEKAMDNMDAEEAKVYQCPMKCEGDKTYDTKTTCPVCGMDLEEIEA